MYPLIRKALFKLPAEDAHHYALTALKFAEKFKILKIALPIFARQEPVMVMGIPFPNKIGMAAGLDKNGEYIDGLGAIGFGFVEVGTVTPRPQPGNPQPRLFRLPEAEGIINRMGFNNQGVDYLIEQVKKSKFKGTLGINIGKNFDTPVENAVDDYLICLKKVYPYADYITVNISSPNTPGLRTLQYGEELRSLIAPIKAEQAKLAEEHGKYVPVAVKVAPDLDEDEIASMAEVFLSEKIDGLIATNTTLSRDGVENLEYGKEQGGLSGKPVTRKSTEVIRLFHEKFGDQIPIIGVGGISSSKDALDKLDAGARLVQIYTGFIYQGPKLVQDCILATRP